MTDLDERPRFVVVAGLHNLRDVGGYAVDGGGTTRWGLLYRGGALEDLGAASHEPMAGIGLRTIVDMREDTELEDLPPSLFPAGVTGHRNPLYRGRISIAEMDTLEEIYREILAVCAPEIVAVLELLAGPDALPALVHCSAGKDRTGLVIGLLLSALGVSDDLVARDYGITESAWSDDERERMVRKGLAMGAKATRIDELIGSPPALMHAILAWVRSEYGSAEGYLLAGGLRPESLDSLRDRLVG